MAKTYAQSVKLPNLVAVAHPSTKFLPRDGLNVEGRSSANGASAYSLNRKDYIKSLMGGRTPRTLLTPSSSQHFYLIFAGDATKSKAKGRDGILVNAEQVGEF